MEAIQPIDYSKGLELFETASKIFAVPMEVKRVWIRIRFFSWFRATLTSWLNALMKNHIEKNQKEYRHLLAKIGPKAFKRPPLAHRNGITTE